MMYLKHYFFSLGLLFALSQQVIVGADSSLDNAATLMETEEQHGSLRKLTTANTTLDEHHRMLKPRPTLTRIRVNVKTGDDVVTVDLDHNGQIIIQQGDSLEWVLFEGRHFSSIRFLVGGRGVKTENQSPWNFCETQIDCFNMLEFGWNNIRAQIYNGDGLSGKVLWVDFRISYY